MTLYTQHNRWSSWFILGIAISSVIIFQTTVNADLVSEYSSAISEWKGTKGFTGGSRLFVDVEYAVYAPGNFNTDFPGLDPSNGGQYVYAYQLLNDNTSTDSIRKITIALESNASAANISQISDPDPALPSGISALPLFAGSPPGSATWSYTSSARVAPGLKSEILIFTSPYSPQWASSPIAGFSSSSAGYVPDGLPSPIPEPFVPLSLALAGGLFFLARRRRG